MKDRILQIYSARADREFIADALTGRRLSYRDFFGMGAVFAMHLVRAGIPEGGRVAILLNNSVEYLAVYLGCLFANVTAVPINTALHSRDVKYICDISNIQAIVCAPSTRAIAGEALHRNCPIIGILPLNETVTDGSDVVWQELKTGPDGWNGDCRNYFRSDAKSSNLLSINFTSGTTSFPKGVAHTIKGLLGNAEAFNRCYGLKSESRMLHLLPMYYMAGFLNTFLCPLMAGAGIVLTRQFDPSSAFHFWDPVMQYEADTVWLTPTMLSILIKIDRNASGIEYCRKKMKTIFVGTAPLPLKVKTDFEKKYGIEVFESYGLSELLFVSANSEGYSRVAGSVGHILPELDISVRDGSGAPISEGEGELFVKTPYAALGYLDESSARPEPFNSDGWFKTGDIGFRDPAGNLFISGRTKDLIIRGGFNISPRAIEEQILRHPSVEQVAVIGLPHELHGEEVAAVIKYKRSCDPERERSAVEALCRNELTSISVPTRFYSIREFPTNTTGKILKNKLREEILAGMLVE